MPALSSKPPVAQKSIGRTLSALFDRYSRSTDISSELDLIKHTNLSSVAIVFDPDIKGGTSSVDGDHKSQIEAITKLMFSSDSLNVPVPSYTFNATLSDLRPGDIIKLNRSVKFADSLSYLSTPYYLVVTDVVDSYGRAGITTWPSINRVFSSGTTFGVIRPDYTSVDIDSLSAMILPKYTDEYEQTRTDTRKDKWITISRSFSADPGFLQIGDIKFFVDPTQISFMTQNGYQFFPTLRTQGNPKIPSLQEVKTISINLIFPNQDTVNNNLIPLLAMYKRAPFVSIRNKDVLDFFAELLPVGANFLPVALEGIQIQSIPGFPDSMQANISLLPFQSELVTEQFKVLRTIDDVKAQQWYFTDRSFDKLINQSKSRLYNTGFPIEEEVAEPLIDSTENFEESIPFRSFYQALIFERDNVTDSLGRKVTTVDGSSLPLTQFRPSKESSYLHLYDSEQNRLPIQFEYSYVSTEKALDLARAISTRRLDAGSELLQRQRQMLEIITDKDRLSEQLHQTFTTRDDIISQSISTLKEPALLVDKWLADNGVEYSPPTKAVKSSVTTLLKMIAVNKLNDVVPVRSFLELAGLPKTITVDDVTKISDTTPINFLQELNGIPDVTFEGFVTGKELADYVAKTIAEYLKSVSPDSPEIEKWSNFIISLVTTVDDTLNDSINKGDPELGVQSLPITKTSFKLHPKYDVVVGWSATFSNKFIPMFLQGAKYPFYQHLGSDDITMSLRIHSHDVNTRVSLRNQLSLLNDRIQNSAKLVLMNAPELAAELDPRLSISTGEKFAPGHIFSVLGIQKVVYDNSRVGSIEGQPGSWDITMNLTQANFTIREYHEVEELLTHKDLTEELLNIITRASITSDGNIQINKYKLNYGSLISDLSKTSNDAVKALINEDIQNIPSNKSAEQTIIYFGSLDDADSSLADRSAILQKENSSELIEKRNLLLNNLNKVYLTLDFFNREFTKIFDAQQVGTQQKKEDAAFDANTFTARAAGDAFNFWSSFKNLFVKKNQTQGVGVDIKLLDNDVAELANMFKSGYITQEKDNIWTTKIQKAITNNPELSDILKLLIHKKNQLHDTELNIIIQLFGYLQSDKRAVWEQVFSSRGVQIGSALTILSTIFLATDFAGFIPQGKLVSWVVKQILLFSLAGVASSVGATYLENTALNARSAAQQFLANSLKGSINNIFGSLKYSFMSKIGDKVLKDPIVLADLFNEELAIESYKQSRGFGVNCYPDFDVPVSAKTTWSNKYYAISENLGFSMAPDFYLYNYDVAKRSKSMFIQDSVKKSIKMGKLASMTTLLEYNDTIAKFQLLESQFSTAITDSDLRSRIKSDLDFTNSQKDPTSPTYFDDLITSTQQLYVSISKELSSEDGAIDPDKFKFNLVAAARMTRIVDLLTAQVHINLALAGTKTPTELEAKELIANNKLIDKSKEIYTKITNKSTTSIPYSLSDQNYTSLKEMFDSLYTLFNSTYFSTKVISSDEATSNDQVDAPNDDITKQYSFVTSKLTSPTLDKFERYIYKLITDVIIMSNALWDFKKTGDVSVFNVLTDIPEIKMLDYYNWRFVEDQAGKQAELLRTFAEESLSTMRGRTKKLYPTYKIYFIEEDRGIVKRLDDFYSYNAIQSIEIANNKYSASSTAIISLSNVTNSLTNPLSILKESGDLLYKMTQENDNVFFGHLDVKPGTKMVIKLGYDANDANLPIRFVGRIVEMTPGSTCKIIAQGFGAQLNHEITKLNFGFWSTENGMGDVVRAILDSIPGLEGLGTAPPVFLGDSVDGNFSGKNFRGLNSNFIDKFLLSNIMSSVHSSLFSIDNPRDDNIFLQYDYFNTVGFRADAKPTFDWLVFQQTVWQALNEVTLYNRNCFPMIKLYNNDSLSSMNDLRETIFVGDKSGYYKYTDSFSLSTKDYKGIKSAVDDWNSLILRLENNPNIKTVCRDAVARDGIYSMPVTELTARSAYPDVNGNTFFIAILSDNAVAPEGTDVAAANTRIKSSIPIDSAFVPPTGVEQVGVLRPDIADDFLDLVRFMQNPYGPLILAWTILNTSQFNGATTVSQFSIDYLKSQFPILDRSDGNSLTVLLRNIFACINTQQIPEVNAIRNSLVTKKHWNVRGEQWDGPLIISYCANILYCLFSNVTDGGGTNSATDPASGKYYLGALKGEGKGIDYTAVLDIHPAATGSTDKKFINHPAYKRVQKHHLVSDTSDILANNISLSNDFNNCVTVYYTDEPQPYTGIYNIPSNKLDTLKSWTIKSFGELKDSQVRLLETYQKNIDTNWWDTRDAGVSIFQKYAKMSSAEIKDKAPNWDALPAFATVSVNLLQREVEKMYRGTLELVGNPNIDPGDIIHLDDVINDMNGPIEVEEVIESFTPNGGYRTIITPALITYDRDPITGRDISTINRMMTTLDTLRSKAKQTTKMQAAFGLLGIGGVGGNVARTLYKGGLSTVGAIGGWVTAAAVALGAITFIYNGTLAIDKQYTKSIYAQMANLFGRDCINFSTLMYHGKPYMSGFDGVDYTNISTIINHQLAGEDFVTRLSAAKDTELLWILSGGDFSNLGFMEKLGTWFPNFDNTFKDKLYGVNLKRAAENSNTNIGNGLLSH